MYNSLDQIINAINNATSDKSTEYFGGSDLRSAEQIAAAYAVEAAADMEPKTTGFSFEELDPHFDTLIENGAVFDFSQAMEIAQSK